MILGASRVVVTGGLGWLGQGLLSALSGGLAGCEALAEPQADLTIRVLVHPSEDPADVQTLAPGAEIVVGDLRRRDDCTQLLKGQEDTVIFHAAGLIHPWRPYELYDTNVTGTENLLAAAENAGARRIVAVSSNSPCGVNPRPDHLFDESSPYVPYMAYGRSKMQMEQAVHAAQGRGRLETVILRPTWFYGPHQPPRQTLFFQMVRDGGAPIVGGGNAKRSMAYIDNTVQGMLLAAASERAIGQTYWMADERPYTMNEIVDTIERLLETEFGQTCRHRRLRLPGFASDVARVLDRGIQATGLYHQKIHVLSEMACTIACSVDKAKRELGYAPTVALEEGMRRSLQWVVDRGGLE